LPGGVRAALQLFRARNATAQANSEWVKSNRVKMPVLALGGEGGTGSTLFDQLSMVADNVEGGVIKNCGHWIIIECPDVFLIALAPSLKVAKLLNNSNHER
jgi:pimeloyl-ACP methyl ester carboxylesterase